MLVLLGLVLPVLHLELAQLGRQVHQGDRDHLVAETVYTRYIRPIAITSGSHWRHRVVQRLSFTKVQDI